MNHLRETLAQLVQGHELTDTQLRSAFDDLLDPNVPPELAAAWLTALRFQPETPAILSSAVDAVNSRMLSFGSLAELGPIRLDTCGTGGDHASSLNISTAAAFVAASAGVTVVKHGNRAATGSSGSSEVLGELGVQLDISVAKLRESARRFHFAFLFAPSFHPALKTLAPIRKQLPFRTIFNLVGPLANPACPTHQLLGVADASLGKLFAQVLHTRGIHRAAVVTGLDRLDEVSLGAPTQVLLVHPGGYEEHLWHPELTFGLPQFPPDRIRVSSPSESAQRIRAVFEGKSDNPADEAYILANAAAALWVAEQVQTPMDGVELARSIIDSGAALNRLDQYAAFSQAC